MKIGEVEKTVVIEPIEAPKEIPAPVKEPDKVSTPA